MRTEPGGEPELLLLRNLPHLAIDAFQIGIDIEAEPQCATAIEDRAGI